MGYQYHSNDDSQPIDRIPLVDLGSFFRKPFPNDPDFPSDEQRQACNALEQPCRDAGFCFVDGLPVGADLLDKMFDHATQMFVNRSAEEKQKLLAPIARPSHVGYQRFELESLNLNGGPDPKESYNFKFNHLYQDYRGCSEGFTQDGKQFWDEMVKVSERIATALAIIFNVPTDHFVKMMGTQEETVFRMTHYPPVDDCPPSTNGPRVRCGEHSDYGLFTLLYTDGPGLQVRDLRGNNKWLPADCKRSKHLPVMLFGGLFARNVNDIWKALPHRVITPDPPFNAQSRLSVACFFAPDSATVSFVHPNIAKEEDAKYIPITTYEYFKECLVSIGEKVTY